jgi:hypothetical protein
MVLIRYNRADGHYIEGLFPMTPRYLLNLLLLATSALASEPATNTELGGLSWLAGSWRSDTLLAHYSSPEGNLILSMSKHLDGGQAVFFEFERFQMNEGRVVYTPYPGGRQSSDTFPMVEHDPAARRAVFENPAHDFPQRFIFHRRDDDRLVITTTDMDNERQIVFDLRRVGED